MSQYKPDWARWKLEAISADEGGAEAFAEGWRRSGAPMNGELNNWLAALKVRTHDPDYSAWKNDDVRRMELELANDDEVPF